MKILGADLSYTATGIAVLDQGPPRFLEVGTRASEHEDPASGLIGRAAYIGDYIRDEALGDSVDLVAIEAPGFQAARNAGQPINTGILHGIVRYLLDEANLPVLMVPPNVWRKVLFGKGNLRKEEVRLEVYRKFQIEHKSTDVLEAFCVAKTAQARQFWAGGEPFRNLTKAQVEAITQWQSGGKRRRKTA